MFSCEENPCILHIPKGKQKICIRKENYEEICEEIVIPWKKTLSWSPLLQRLPTLNTLQPENIPQTQNPSLTARSDDGTLYQFQKENGKISRISPNKETENITAFSNLDPIALLSFGDDLLLQTPTNVFLILTRNKRRYEIDSGKETKLRVLSPDLLFLEKGSVLFSFSKKDVIPQKLPFFFPIDQITLCQDTLFFADVHGEEVTFGSMDSIGKVKQEIFQGKLGSTESFRLECGKDENELFILFGEKQGYQLDW